MRCPTCHRRVAERCPRHGPVEARSPGSLPEPPAVAGHVLGAPLGRGGFGRVFAARREVDGLDVALKVLEPLAGERLGRELEALRRIGPPAVPRLLGEATTRAGERVVIMERIEGPTLAQRLAKLPGAGALSWADAAPLTRALAEALAQVHAAGVVHRDLKPENVVLSEGRLVLLDFGLAWLTAQDDGAGLSPGLTRTGQRLGTHEYMSPEQCRDARYIDARADLYALGVMFFELLCGRPPFVGEAAAVLQGHVSRRPPAMRTLAPWPVPAAVETLVQRLLAKVPEDRGDSARALAAELRELQGAGDAVGTQAVSGALAENPRRATEAPRTNTGPSTVPTPDTSRATREVAVLGVKSSLDAPALQASLAGSGAILARVEPGLCLFAFPHEAAVEAGLRAALRAAEVLKAALPPNATLALHCAPLRIRERAGRLTVGGAAVERPERWWPSSESVSTLETVALTASARAHLGDLPYSTPHGDALTSPDLLLGRDTERRWLREALSRAQAHGAPVLRTLLAEEGHGKTRLLTTWRSELEGTPGVSVRFVEALPDEGSASESGLRSLINTVLGLPSQTPSDEALRRLLADARPPVDVATVHPAARRQLVARAIAAHLWRLAAAQPLVLLVDDAHTLDPTALDALELATLSGEGAPLCVVLAGRHRLLGLRPYLGERARDAEQRELPPLPEHDARELLRQWLRPVDLIAEGVLRELVDRSGGSPLRMLETVRALRGAGAIRTRPDGGGYLAADALNGLAPDRPGADERLAERSLSGLPTGMRAPLQVAALLGDDVRLEELTATLAHLETDASLDLSLDPGVAMERLARAGMLEPRGPRRWRFEHTTLREAFTALLPPPLKRRICAAALRALPATPTARRARLAESAGDSLQATALHWNLAESARHAHRLLEAERHYSAALSLVPRAEEAVRLELLSGRGRVRYRLQRIDDAVEDLRAARLLAEAHRDVVREADLLLEEATALDWQDDAMGSTALLEQALHCLKDAVPSELAARHALAQARVLVRREDITGAVPALERAVEAARSGEDSETEAIALAMLGAMLAWTDRLDEASRRFDEAITLCEATGDTLHLGVALNNRMVLHVQRRDAAGAHADLERAVTLGRELGNVQIERTSAFNLALLLGYQGRAVEALPLARRAGVLSQRFFPRSMAQDALLVARLCCELGDLPEVARQLAWLEEPDTRQRLSPSDALMLSVVRRVVNEARDALPYGADAWAHLVEASRRLATPDERLEILVWAARAARKAGDTVTLLARVAEVEETAREAPLWTDRVRALVAPTESP
ncbi:protein kinase [Myxococcus xanthus]|uniref:Protein kinase n=1 Tax=Myxococcus xanthus TaxID=34 RepID=A0A7Y4MQE4_MYXXA|nr:serine/threonine-protein kinase [Myxococcus xanthus]NOJ78342.1 protein kinase [Myxococcus xanthus]NOJ85436.1 protein kinase [Myxococcus xanthus]